MLDRLAEIAIGILALIIISLTVLNTVLIQNHMPHEPENVIISEALVIEPEEVKTSEPTKCWQSIYFMSIPVSVTAFNTCTGEVKEYPLLVIQEVMKNNMRRADERIERARKSLSM